jgi:N-acetylglucosaminyldiphosphoundecaprenol N-acetyl-beta-D-mannosaminyltransferase
MRTDVLGVGFDDLTMDEAVSAALELMERPGASWVVTPNPEIVWMCRKDKKLRNAVANASLVLADGIGVVYGAKILGRPLKSKVPGCDFGERVFAEMAARDKKLYLLGAKPGVAEKAAENLKNKYPGLQIVGCADGYFKESDPVVEKINAAAPDFLLVCLGAPKQEYWMADHADVLNVRLMAGLGGSLDVFAGTVERAPEAWQKHGLEWLYRLKKEPKRIGRMMKLPLFIIAVLWQRIKGK